MKRILIGVVMGLGLIPAIQVGLFVYDLATTERRYFQALRSGRENIELVQQFHQLFGDATTNDSILYFGFSDKTWSSSTTLHGRYELSMQFPISIRYGAVTATGEPKIHLTEYTLVERGEGGTIHSRFDGGIQHRFGIHDWNVLVENEGDFQSLGLELKTDARVENFELIEQLYTPSKPIR